MKKIIQLCSIAIVTVLLFACGRNSSDESLGREISEADSLTAPTSSSAAVENNKDSVHKFIRTADLRFKVKDVVQSTYAIEDITNRNGGFVTYTNLSSNANNVETTRISEDSSLESTYYTVTNTVMLRVPNTKLDTTLKQIAANVEFLDYRVIKADDVSLQILANKLRQKRTQKTTQRLTNQIDSKGTKLKDITQAEETLSNKQEQTDNATLANQSLQDQISYSTVSLAIYQREAFKHELIANNKNITAYEPGFGSKLIEALQGGWDILSRFILLLVRLWGILLVAIIGWLVYRRFKNGPASV